MRARPGCGTRWLRWLCLCASLLGGEARIRYARQQSIGQPWMPGQPLNHGGWDHKGQLDQTSFVGSLPNGDICVADSKNHRIHVISHEGVPSRPTAHPDYRELGGFGDAPGKMYRPVGCTGDASGVLYVVDSYNHRLQKINISDGRPLRQAGRYGAGPGELKFPQGLALVDGVLHVADTRNHRIAIYDTNLRFVFAFGKRGTGPGDLSHPQGVAALGSTIYVADSGNDRVQVYTARGKFLRSIGQSGSEPGQFNLPSDVSLAHGRVYVSEFHGQRVQVLTPQGSPVQILRLQGVGALSSVDADIQHERVYVADFEHHRVHVLAIRGITHENATSGTLDREGVSSSQGGGPLDRPSKKNAKGSKGKGSKASREGVSSSQGGGPLDRPSKKNGKSSKGKGSKAKGKDNQQKKNSKRNGT